MCVCVCVCMVFYKCVFVSTSECLASVYSLETFHDESLINVVISRRNEEVAYNLILLAFGCIIFIYTH